MVTLVVLIVAALVAAPPLYIFLRRRFERRRAPVFTTWLVSTLLFVAWIYLHYPAALWIKIVLLVAPCATASVRYLTGRDETVPTRPETDPFPDTPYEEIF